MPLAGLGMRVADREGGSHLSHHTVVQPAAPLSMPGLALVAKNEARVDPESS